MWKCAGLTDEQVKTASVRPSSLTLLGLVRHMTEVERVWFRVRADGQDLPDLYSTQEDRDGEFDNVADAEVEHDLATFSSECLEADEAVRTMDLEEIFVYRDMPVSLRWVYVHMLEEYARHNGHADLLRECIDGATGD